MSTNTSGSTGSEPAAARGQPLVLDGRQPGTGSEDQPQPRELRASAEGVPCPPGRLQLGDVARRPGAHHDGTRTGGRRRARVHEHRLAGELGDPEHLTDGVPARRPGWPARSAGSCTPTNEPASSSVEPGRGPGPPAGTEAHGREVRRQLERTPVPGVDQRAGLVSRQRLDPERGGEADAGQPDAGVAGPARSDGRRRGRAGSIVVRPARWLGVPASSAAQVRRTTSGCAAARRTPPATGAGAGRLQASRPPSYSK